MRKTFPGDDRQHFPQLRRTAMTYPVYPFLIRLVLSIILTLTFVLEIRVKAHVGAQQEPRPMATNPTDLLRAGANQTKAFKVRDNIFIAYGFGNTMMVTTPEGNVIIDTSIAAQAPRHVRLLKAESAQPTKYIILTHAHGDHTGGVGLWKEAGTQIIAQT